jgi:hypothetical protein
MASVPLKPQYGPTLGQLLAPRWRSSPRWLRGALIGAVLALAALVAAVVLTLLPASYSHPAPPSFSFTYRGLYRTKPPAGAYVSLQRRQSGTLTDSFTVWPLQLPPYQGSPGAELPLIASAYIAGLERRERDFVLLGEGRTKVNGVNGYSVFYTRRLAGELMDGRDVLLVGESPGARRGVRITMLTAPEDETQVKSALEVGNSGLLKRPLHGFELG